jgi:hypothetical protein
MDIYDVQLYGGSAIAAFTVLGALLYRVRQNNAQSWPRAEATVGSASVGETKADNEKVWYVRVSYSFDVNGAFYSGMTDRMVSSPEAAREMAPKIAGKKFPVRYKQGKPDTSVVIEEEWAAAMRPRY